MGMFREAKGVGGPNTHSVCTLDGQFNQFKPIKCFNHDITFSYRPLQFQNVFYFYHPHITCQSHRRSEETVFFPTTRHIKHRLSNCVSSNSIGWLSSTELENVSIFAGCQLVYVFFYLDGFLK